MRNFDENYSLIRVFHAAPGGDTVDIYINDTPFYRGLDFTKFTPYMYIPKGKYTLSVYAESTLEKPILSQEIDVRNDELVTMAIAGDEDNIILLPIKEDKELPQGNNSKIRFVHLVPNGRAVDIVIDNVTTFTDVKFTDITDYKIVPPKEYIIDILVSENKQTVDRDKVNVNPHRIYTFYAIGYAPNFDVIQSVDGATVLR